MLITALNVARRDGFGSVNAWIRAVSGRFYQNRQISAMWDGKAISGAPVQAFVDHGRWLAMCEHCSNVEYVAPGEPFYCIRCANAGNSAARPVEFPVEREQIEKALLARPVVENDKLEPVDRARRAVPVIPGLLRSWAPGVSVETLEAENMEALHGL
jgi:hypothetical protein